MLVVNNHKSLFCECFAIRLAGFIFKPLALVHWVRVEIALAVAELLLVVP